jgi:DNA-binding NarL/FixJ family response regulator
MTIRVLVADDQDLVRAGLSMILDSVEGMSVVAEAATGHDALEAARIHRPDVCLLDIRMPGLDGIEVTRQLAGPGVPNPMRVVVVTTFDLEEYLVEALAAGACGFVLKTGGPELLVAAVQAAHAGESLISPAMTTRLLRHLDLGQLRSSGGPEAQTELSERERQVLLLVADGRTNAEIAQEIHVSMSTVKFHLAALMGRLSARNRVDLVVWAYRNRLVP